MDGNADREIYKAQPWRCISPIIITVLIIYIVLQAGKNNGGSHSIYYFFAIIIGLIGLVITYTILRSNVVVKSGKLSHRNVFGIKSKTIDLNSLSKAYVRLGWWPRLGNVLCLEDHSGNKIRLFLGDRIFGVLFSTIIPNFHHTRDLLNTVGNYASKSGINFQK
jgi:glycopeptide antibiotics resistance protein